MTQRIVCPVQQPDAFNIAACAQCRHFEMSIGKQSKVHCRKNRSRQHRLAFESAVWTNRIGHPDRVIVEGTEEPQQYQSTP